MTCILLETIFTYIYSNEIIYIFVCNIIEVSQYLLRLIWMTMPFTNKVNIFRPEV